jgi:alkanesulfonate monooxygenase SsuD/methylene tetrahydromethanopterin reductase-like flavin-dependent oxidoreductase (luciferase family)
MVAARKFSYMGIPYFHIDFFQRNFDTFREACEKSGYTADPHQLGWLCPIYVADSDEQAWAEYEPHFTYFRKKLLKGLTVFPPGYTSAKSMIGINQALKKFLLNVETREEIEKGAYAIVGSPETVREKLTEYLKRLGVGNLLGLFQLGTLPADLTRKNMTLFAEKVMPAVRQSRATLQSDSHAVTE